MSAGNVSFAIARPEGWQEIDLLSPDARPELGGALTDALATAARGSEHARMLMLRSLLTLTDAGEPLAAGLSVMLADRSAPVSSAPLSSDEFERAEVAAITLPVGAGMRVRHVAPAKITGSEGLVNVLRVQYMLETAPGLLTITLTTPQAARTREWEQLFDAMARTAQLDWTETGQPGTGGIACL